MKKILLLKNVLFLFLATFAMGAGAQSVTPPADPAWRTGTLDNGMRYYIRKNAKPEGKGNFYILHDVGALQEKPNQNGLAHFLEHMAFNGLKNFPGKSMLEYMQSIGCRFGANINASTGQPLTQYLLTDVPLDREGIIDTCLLILHDWSGHILCEKDELDNERGVIREEWRTGNSADRRTWNAQSKIFYPGTAYATRSVIGDTSIINNFTQEEILDFYHTWYRPNMQAIILVGDFDVDKMEAKVKKLFPALKNPANPKAKEEINLCDNAEPIIGTYADPELTQSRITFLVKYPHTPKADRNNESYLRSMLVKSMASQMLNSRLGERSKEKDVPFLYGVNFFTDLAGNRDAFYSVVITKNGGLEQGFRAAMEVIEQARRHGFTAGEWERAKSEHLRQVESSYKERNTKLHREFMYTASQNFRNNTPLVSEEYTLNFAKKMLPTITLEEINKALKDHSHFGPNTAIFASGPSDTATPLPTDEAITTIMYGVQKQDIKPYVDQTLTQPMLAAQPKAGKIKSEKKNSSLGTVEWTLSNGAKVVYKKTDFKQDEILFQGIAAGGISLLSPEKMPIAGVVSAMNGGAGNYNSVDMSKYTKGKKVSLYTGIQNYNQVLSGNCSPNDISSLLEMIHGYFVAPNFDANDFASNKADYLSWIKNRNLEPSTAFYDSVSLIAYNYHPLYHPLTEKDIENLTLEQCKAIYMERFANVSNFSFSFVGNLDPSVFKPLVEKYLASLPAGKKETFADLQANRVKGKIVRHFERPMKTGKASASIVYSGDFDQSIESKMALTYLTRILQLRYTEEIREKRGGTYGASVYSGTPFIPKNEYNLFIEFDTDAKMQAELVKVVYDEVEKIAQNGPLADDFQKVKENLLQSRKQDLQQNRMWQGILTNYYIYNNDTYSKWDKVMEKLTPADIQAIAKKIVSDNNIVEVVMLPKN